MKTYKYQIDKLNSNGMTECTVFVNAKNRLDAFAKEEGFTEDDLADVTVNKSNGDFVVSAPSYSANTWRVFKVPEQ
jgi:hypothetical protein